MSDPPTAAHDDHEQSLQPDNARPGRGKWLLLVLAVLVVLYFTSVRSVNLIDGGPATEISAARWFNTIEPFSLATSAGKIRVIEFWATWCGPCMESIPHLNQLAQLRPNEVVVVGLTEEQPDRIADFIREHNMQYAIGAGSTSGRDYDVNYLPDAFVVDPEGTIVWRGDPRNGLEQVIHRLLKDQAGAGPG